MCRVTMAHAIRCRIRTTCLLARLRILSIDDYYHHRLLCWAGHVARMDMSRTPRKSIKGYVENPRPRGCPYMTWGWTLKKALKPYQLSTKSFRVEQDCSRSQELEGYFHTRTKQRSRRERPYCKGRTCSSSQSKYVSLITPRSRRAHLKK